MVTGWGPSIHLIPKLDRFLHISSDLDPEKISFKLFETGAPYKRTDRFIINKENYERGMLVEATLLNSNKRDEV